MLSNFIFLIILFIKGIKLLTMKQFYHILALTSVVFILLPISLKAQQKNSVSSSTPVIILSEDKKSEALNDGLINKAIVEKHKDSLNKKGIKEDVNTSFISVSTTGSTGGITKTFTSKHAGVDRIIKYGPWQMQNKLRLMTDSIADILRFGITRNINLNKGLSGKVKQKVIKPDMGIILKLNQHSQITVLEGHLYSVQVGQFAFNKYAYTAMDRISGITTLPIIVVIKNRYYHLLVEGFQSMKDANGFIGQLAKIGFKGTLVKIQESGNASDAVI
jgi:hypothetical protein